MSMLNNTSGQFAAATAIRDFIGSCWSRLAHLVNRWIATVIAHRKHQANLFVLGQFTDKELKDIGLYRNQVGEGLAEAAKDRSALQEFRQRQSMMS
ncbi:MAG: hypothetical protein ACRED3_11620 [Bradyrhizobium sp.]